MAAGGAGDPRLARGNELGATTWLVLLVPLSFILMGGGGGTYRLLRLGTSAERRAAIAKRAAQFDLFDPGRPANGKYPSVPDCATITDSPGTRLAFRLPVGSSIAWFLFWLGLGCALWNTVVGVFVVMAVRGHLEHRPDWWLSCSILPFALAGIALIVYFVRQLLVTTGVDLTLIEVSQQPLHPGDRCQVFLSQAGRLR